MSVNGGYTRHSTGCSLASGAFKTLVACSKCRTRYAQLVIGRNKGYSEPARKEDGNLGGKDGLVREVEWDVL